MSEVEEVEAVEVEAETVEGEPGKHRGRVSKYPEDVALAAQKMYRKEYNRQFKANQTILKAGGDIEVTAAEAGLNAKSAYLVEAGFED
jgi:hypothetical protein